MTPWMRRMHKWVGLLIGVQFVLWMASGAMMSLLDAEKVGGRQFRVKASAPGSWPVGAVPAANLLANMDAPVRSVATSWLLSQPVYVIDSVQGTRLHAAMTGQRLDIDAQSARSLAMASYSGPGKPGKPRLLASTSEARNHTGPLWAVDFADAEDTSVYLSATTGAVLEHRNRTWRLFDVFWMLHIMDYTERKDFNNPLVITSGIGGLWLALTGVWLLMTSLRLSEFVPARWRARRMLDVYVPGEASPRTLSTAAGESVFSAMAGHGLPLPSNCGGGQSCGLCEVRVVRNAPRPTSADRSHFSIEKLDAGYRLACNLTMDGDRAVEVPGGAALGMEYGAAVTSVRDVGPFLREIILKPDMPVGAAFRPGSYLQVHVPPYSVALGDVASVAHADLWDRLGLPSKLSSTAQVRRAYSLSSPVQQADGNLALLVRFMGMQRGEDAGPVGTGSTYMYSLKPGDQVRFSGPFGDFALKDSGREKVFIGGGAGMAPLRAMLRAHLQGGAREQIHFWYGARTLLDAPYVEEMAALAEAHDNFTWCLVLSDMPENTHGTMTGFVHDVAHALFLGTHPNLSSCEFYLCGPPAMLAATRQLLAALGVDEAMIAFDDFKV